MASGNSNSLVPGSLIVLDALTLDLSERLAPPPSSPYHVALVPDFLPCGITEDDVGVMEHPVVRSPSAARPRAKGAFMGRFLLCARSSKMKAIEASHKQSKGSRTRSRVR